MKMLGLGFMFGAKDKGLGKGMKSTSDGLSSIERAAESMSKALKGNFLPKFLQSISTKKLGDISAGIDGLGDKMGGRGGLTTSMEAFGIQAAKSMAQTRFQVGNASGALSNLSKGIAGAAFALNADAGNAQAAWKTLVAKGLEPAELAIMGIKNATDLVKVSEMVGDFEGYTGVLHDMLRGWNMAPEQAKRVIDSVYKIGGSFGQGEASVQALNETMGVIDQTFHGLGNMGPKEVEKAITSLTMLTGAFRSSGQNSQKANASAREVFEFLHADQKAMLKAFDATADGGSDLFSKMKKMALITGDVGKAQEALTKDPMQFVMGLLPLYDKLNKAGDKRTAAEQAQWATMHEVFKATGMGFVLASDGARKYMTSMVGADGQLKKLGKGFLESAKDAHKTGRTIDEVIDLIKEGFETKLNKIARKEIRTFVKRTRHAYKSLGNTLEDFASDKGPLGLLTTKLIAVSRVGLAGLLPGIGAFGDMMIDSVAAAAPMLTAVGSLGFRFSDLAAPVRSANRLLGGLPGTLLDIAGPLAVVGGGIALLGKMSMSSGDSMEKFTHLLDGSQESLYRLMHFFTGEDLDKESLKAFRSIGGDAQWVIVKMMGERIAENLWDGFKVSFFAGVDLIKKWTPKLARTLYDETVKLWPDVQKGMKDAYDFALHKGVPWVKEWSVKLGSRLMTALREVDYKALGQQIITSLGKGFAAIKLGVGPIGEMGAAIGRYAKAGFVWLGEHMDEVAGIASTVLGGVSGLMWDGLTKALDAAGDAGLVVSDIAGVVVDTLGKGLNRAATLVAKIDLVKLADKLTGTLGAMFQGAWSGATGIVDADDVIVDPLERALFKVGDSIGRLTKAIVDTMQKVFMGVGSEVADKISDWWSEPSKSIVDKLGEGLKTAGLMAMFSGTFRSALLGGVTAAVGAVQFGVVSKRLKDISTSLCKGMVPGESCVSNNTTANLQGGVRGAAGKVKGWAKGAWGRAGMGLGLGAMGLGVGEAVASSGPVGGIMHAAGSVGGKAAMGAGVGFTAGGPWGALVGGVGGALYGLYDVFTDVQENIKAKSKALTDSYRTDEVLRVRQRMDAHASVMERMNRDLDDLRRDRAKIEASFSSSTALLESHGNHWLGATQKSISALEGISRDIDGIMDGSVTMSKTQKEYLQTILLPMMRDGKISEEQYAALLRDGAVSGTATELVAMRAAVLGDTLALTEDKRVTARKMETILTEGTNVQRLREMRIIELKNAHDKAMLGFTEDKIKKDKDAKEGWEKFDQAGTGVIRGRTGAKTMDEALSGWQRNMDSWDSAEYQRERAIKSGTYHKSKQNLYADRMASKDRAVEETGAAIDTMVSSLNKALPDAADLPKDVLEAYNKMARLSDQDGAWTPKTVEAALKAYDELSAAIAASETRVIDFDKGKAELEAKLEEDLGKVTTKAAEEIAVLNTKMDAVISEAEAKEKEMEKERKARVEQEKQMQAEQKAREFVLTALGVTVTDLKEFAKETGSATDSLEKEKRVREAMTALRMKDFAKQMLVKIGRISAETYGAQMERATKRAEKWVGSESKESAVDYLAGYQRGGVADFPSSGRPALLHGRELVFPLDHAPSREAMAGLHEALGVVGNSARADVQAIAQGMRPAKQVGNVVVVESKGSDEVVEALREEMALTRKALKGRRSSILLDSKGKKIGTIQEDDAASNLG